MTSKIMTATKLELDKSRRKLTFADCEPGQEIEAALAENSNNNYDRLTVGGQEESVLAGILERECLPQNPVTVNNWDQARGTQS